MKFNRSVLRVFVVTCLILAGGISSSVARQPSSEKKPKNVIYMIGDGMGLATISAVSMTARPLTLEQFPYVGLQKTVSANSQVTDSAASATALATGVKTNNGMVGLTPEGNPVESVLVEAQKRGQSTGLVVTVTITHATPGGFYGHNKSRKNEEEIALDLLTLKPDVFIGGGLKFFAQRNDGRDLVKELAGSGYQVATSLSEVLNVREGKLAGLLAEGYMRPVRPQDGGESRGDLLPKAVEQAIQILKQNPKGFFLMVEGSQIDGFAHKNQADGMIGETLDFDEAIKKAFEFAKADGNTLVIVTADHETGGVTLPNEGGKVKISYSTKGHTGVMVPVFAYGPGAEKFTGVYDNTDIPRKIRELTASAPAAKK